MPRQRREVNNLLGLVQQIKAYRTLVAGLGLVGAQYLQLMTAPKIELLRNAQSRFAEHLTKKGLTVR